MSDTAEWWMARALAAEERVRQLSEVVEAARTFGHCVYGDTDALPCNDRTGYCRGCNLAAALARLQVDSEGQ